MFEAGATEEGRPYFAMEYVPGVPITSYCDVNRLSIGERLELFRVVCHGVQHQRGIIHRDLKPSNILVTIQDDGPVPKIIDFGVARAIHQRLTEHTLAAETGHWVGTPEYMSPEQAEITPLDIDTRTDVYSLGVVLYELLTGTLPFEGSELRSGGLVEMRRRIREQDPPRPSARLSGLGDRRTTVVGQRRTDATSLARRLRGDLDWIVMKSLEKDRTRRYGTAAELAADLDRHLHHEPVVASPSRTLYRFGKFVRRHRLAVAVATVVALAVGAAVVGTSIGLLRARRAEAQAVRDAETARQVSEFLVKLFSVADPREARGDTITAREVLDAGATRIETELRDQPAVMAQLMDTMGRVYQNLGLYDDAIRLMEKAVSTRRALHGGDHLEVAQSLNNLASLEWIKADYEAALEHYQEALAMRRRLLGDRDLDVGKSLANLGVIYWSTSRYDEAEAVFRESLVILQDHLGSDHADVAQASSNLAALLEQRGNHDEAERLFRESLEVYRREEGGDHPMVAVILFNLATVMDSKGDAVAAERLFRETLAIQTRVLGDDHSDTAETLEHLALTLKHQGRYDEAAPLFERALLIQRKALGERHPLVARLTANIGSLLAERGEAAAAEARLREALAMQLEFLGEDHREVAEIREMLGTLLLQGGRYQEAEPLLERAHRVLHEQGGEALAARSRDALVTLYERWGKPEAAARYRAAVE